MLDYTGILSCQVELKNRGAKPWCGAMIVANGEGAVLVWCDRGRWCGAIAIGPGGSVRSQAREGLVP